ncbi:MAG: hypothetical protein ABI589_03595 [Burkholderiales bacterium]
MSLFSLMSARAARFRLSRAARVLATLTFLSGLACESWAFVTSIDPGARSPFLQVGTGRISGGNFASGGTPRNNATINTVSVSVPASNIGSGPVGMTSDSNVSNSPYDGYPFCPGAGSMVYVGGFYRTPGDAASAQLTVQSPPALTSSSGDNIPFSAISWVASGADGGFLPIQDGTFTGGTQALYSASRNTWFEACLTFSYGNAQLVPAGTYTGRVTYTLTAP